MFCLIPRPCFLNIQIAFWIIGDGQLCIASKTNTAIRIRYLCRLCRFIFQFFCPVIILLCIQIDLIHFKIGSCDQSCDLNCIICRNSRDLTILCTATDRLRICQNKSSIRITHIIISIFYNKIISLIWYKFSLFIFQLHQKIKDIICLESVCEPFCDLKISDIVPGTLILKNNAGISSNLPYLTSCCICSSLIGNRPVCCCNCISLSIQIGHLSIRKTDLIILITLDFFFFHVILQIAHNIRKYSGLSIFQAKTSIF